MKGNWDQYQIKRMIFSIQLIFLSEDKVLPAAYNSPQSSQLPSYPQSPSSPSPSFSPTSAVSHSSLYEIQTISYHLITSFCLPPPLTLFSSITQLHPHPLPHVNSLSMSLHFDPFVGRPFQITGFLTLASLVPLKYKLSD